jgi:hypothetical protein
LIGEYFFVSGFDAVEGLAGYIGRHDLRFPDPSSHVGVDEAGVHTDHQRALAGYRPGATRRPLAASPGVHYSGVGVCW